MPYKSLDRLNIDEGCVKKWLEELNPRSAVDYGYFGYKSWFLAKKYWLSAQAMLDDYERLGMT